MTEIAIQNGSSCGVTVIPNLFIENYMPEANGEFVKVYLYLLHILSGTSSFTLADGADALNCTERDILRALKYWAKAGLLELSFDSSKKLDGIRLLPLAGPEKETVPKEQPAKTPAKKAHEEEAAAKTSIPSEGTVKKAAIPTLSLDTIKTLQKDEDFVQLLFIAEQYLGRTLSSTDTNRIAYFYDQLQMSCELIEYLIEYCVSGGHKSIRYIESVALSWAGRGIVTVEQAKEESSHYNKNYFAILKALGIKNRHPVEAEISIMDSWLGEYGFTIDIVKEACTRTVLQTGQSSFQYADRILRDWKDKGVHSVEDIAPLDAKHSRKKTAVRNTPKVAASSGNRFNNFHQRDYDFEELEKQLLNR
ncbi:MAG: DnaD domain protein [Blautia sp.]|jgi:DnaD/phage-associated family protein